MSFNPIDFEQNHVHSIYSKIYKHFHNTRVFTWSWIKEFIHTYVSSLDNDCITILDLGCGNGRNMINYSINKEIKWIGMDMCYELLNQCPSHIDLIQGDMTFIPLQSKSVDITLCIASFHHLSTIERRLRCLEEIKRITKRYCLLSIWSFYQPKKTRRIFTSYGDTFVSWKQTCPNSSNILKYTRYYYIFKVEEFKQLCYKTGIKIISHKWDCGNEIFILEC